MAQDAGAKPKLSGKLMQLKARARRSLLHARSVACCVPCGLTFARFAVHAARGGERPPGGARAGAGARQRRCRANSCCEAKQPPWRGGSAAALTRPPPPRRPRPLYQSTGSQLRRAQRSAGAPQRCSRLHGFALCQGVDAHREGPARRSTVIMEDDPKPGALLGRMSFRRVPAVLRACLPVGGSTLVRRL